MVMPQIQSDPSGVTVSHKEMLPLVVSGDVASSYLVNPARIATFPWLANMAALFDSYALLKFSVEWVPACPTTTAGQVIIVGDYDVLDTPFSEAELATLQKGSVTGAVWAPLTWFYAPRDVVGFARHFTIQSGAADRFSDSLRLEVFVRYTTGQVTLGRFWMSYTVRLMNPQPLPSIPVGAEAQSDTTHSGDLLPFTLPGDLSTASSIVKNALTINDAGTMTFHKAIKQAIVALEWWGTPNGEAFSETAMVSQDPQTNVHITKGNCTGETRWSAGLQDDSLGLISSVLHLSQTTPNLPMTITPLLLAGVFTSANVRRVVHMSSF